MFLSTSIIILSSLSEVKNNKEALLAFWILEIICATWFFFEILLRLFAYPSLLIFIKSPLNIMEFICALTYVLYLAMPKEPTVIAIKNIARSIRMLSYFRLFKHTASLRALTQTLGHSKKEIISYLVYLSLGVLIFSIMCYSIESNEPDTKYSNIPISFWVFLLNHFCHYMNHKQNIKHLYFI
jgi:hypothetical protein